MSADTTKIDALLALIPEAQRAAAADLILAYGPRLWDMAKEDAWQYVHRLMAGDLDAAIELDSKLSNDESIAKVTVNTARWANVAEYNRVRAEMSKEFTLRVAPLALTILLALVGL